MESINTCRNESCAAFSLVNASDTNRSTPIELEHASNGIYQNTAMALFTSCPSMMLLLLLPLSFFFKNRENDERRKKQPNDRNTRMRLASLFLMFCVISGHIVCSCSNGVQGDAFESGFVSLKAMGSANTFTSDLVTGWPLSYFLMTSLIICELFNVITTNNIAVKTLFWLITISSFILKLCSTKSYEIVDSGDVLENIMNLHSLHLFVAFINFFMSVYELLWTNQTYDSNYKSAKDPELSSRSIFCRCLANLTFYWTKDVMITGYRRDLQINDIPKISNGHKSATAFSQFNRNWKIAQFTNEINSELPCIEEKEVEKEPKGLAEEEHNLNKQVKSVSLSKIMIKAFGFKFFVMQFMLASFKLCNYIEPYMTKQFMISIQDTGNEVWTNAVRIVFALFLFNVIREIYNHRLYFEIMKHQTFIISSIKMAIFRKSLKIKNQCTKDKTTADIVNLMSSECDRVEGMSRHFSILVSEPLMICISMLMLYNEVGNATFAGIAILLIFIPFNHFIGKKLTALGLESKDLEDKRTAAMNEIVNGIKALKLYAWEPYFIAKVNGIRRECENCNAKKSLMDAVIDVIFRAIPFIVKSVAFGTFLYLGGHLDAVKAFTAFHLFHMLNGPFSIMALFLPGFVEMAASMKKINEYLNNDNIPEDITERKSNEGKCSVIIKDGNFAWEKKTEGPTECTLKNVNVNIPRGKLVAIVGKVGSGKSSLLSAMLGEMEKLSGRVEIEGNIAYVPQEAWVMNKTLKENIVFGSKENAEHYKRVVNASALIKDIKNMPAGDRSEIGEKGINLSGGQKQRVSMARALYKDADVYLFDDPLSAVDAHVGKHMFNKAIGRKSLIKAKTRVLVTHGIHWLPHVDHILFIKDGAIAESGSYQELTSHHGEFTQFVQHTLTENNDQASSKIQKTRDTILKRIESIPEDQRPGVESVPTDNLIDIEESNNSTESSSEEEELKLSNDTNDARDGSFLEEEEIEQGQIGFRIYMKYAQAVGYISIVLFMFVYVLQTTSDFGNTRVLKDWTEDDILKNSSQSTNKELYDQTNWEYYRLFVLTGASEVMLSFLFVVIILIASYRAATKLHNSLLNRILRCPMSFFDTTSTAKIVGLFSKDIGKIDELGHCLRWFIAHLLDMCNYLLMILIFCPMLAMCIVPFVGIQFIIYKIHSSPARQLRRFNSKYRSPVYAHFTETLNGKESIRAYGCQNEFVRAMENKLDVVNNIDFWEKSVSWAAGLTSMLALRTLQFLIAIFCIWYSLTPGMVGLLTMYASIFCFIVRAFFGLIVHMETEMVALERVVDYSDREMEAPWDIPDKQTDVNWPTDGRVSFDNYQTRYSEGGDLVLKGIDCQIEAGQKVGIVGRTGAGKTSLAMSIFRLLEASDGHINICGERIADLGLHELRSKINILPQDPIIFKGSLKSNLDPAGTKTDDEIWIALQHANLSAFVEGCEGKLEFECGEGGKNLSVGQKQLLCLARTLLRNSPILVLDEATAAVDMKTDAIIQKTIRTAFQECTVLTIAHRLNTVLDYDRIMVLDQGRVAEFDSPENLLKDEKSIFYSMVNDVDHVE